MSVRVVYGDWIEKLREEQVESMNCCVTSPPYWGLRDYAVAGQLGLESTPEEYVTKLVEGFREVRRVLREDGTLWLNLGDSYCSAGGIHDNRTDNQPGVGANRVWRNSSGRADGIVDARGQRNRNGNSVPGLKAKDLVGIPWMVAFALRADGWWLRQDIIWAKTNPMPESVRDRCTRSHEYLFLLSKSERYYFDHAAMREPAVEPARKCGKNSRANVDRDVAHGTRKQDALELRRYQGFNDRYDFENPNPTRNRRDVWNIATRPYKGAHFATFPPKLIEPCVLAGCPPGGTVLDPFGGSGTTGQVAQENGRNALLIELNPAYGPLIDARIAPKVTQ